MKNSKEIQYYISKLESTYSKNSVFELFNKKNLENTAEQEKIISIVEGTQLVIAGAGAGKTRTLIYRIKNMIENKKILPENILVITFTKKATFELRERLEKIEILSPDLTVSTFHSFCYHLLLENKKNIKILTEEEKKIIEQYFCREGKLEELTEYFIKENYYEYEELIQKIVEELKNNENLRKKISQKYKYIMIDEYQDSNEIQREFLMQLYKENSNIMAVGDDFQSIYGFRGGNFSNILLFKKYFPNSTLYKLKKNFRSSKEIVNFINQLSKNIKYKFEKNLIAVNKSAGLPNVILLKNLEKEGEFIAISIKKILRENKFNDKIAILYRNRYYIKHIEESLKNHKILYSKNADNSITNLSSIKNFLILEYFFYNLTEINLEKIRFNMQETYQEKLIKTSFILKKITSNNNDDFLKNELNNFYLNSRYREIQKFYFENKKYLNNKKIFLEKLKEVYSVFYMEKFNLEKELEEIELYIKSLSLYEENDKNSSKVNVTLSTVHSSKGLEWDFVFVSTAMEGIYPDRNNYDNRMKIDEDRRLFYVACSRAKKKLIITAPIEMHWKNNDYTGITSFLEEVNPQFYKLEDKSKY